MSTLHEIGKAVRTRRAEMGLTQEAVARISGLSRSTINAVETQSIGNLSIVKAESLLQSLGLSMTIEAPKPRPLKKKLPLARPALLRAAATASVSYRSEINAVQLGAALLEAKVPPDLRPHVRALLDEAPVSLLAKVVEELSERSSVPPSEIWAHMRFLARELQCYRAVWQ